MQILPSTRDKAVGYAQLKERREAVEALAARRRERVTQNAYEAMSTGRLDIIQRAKQMAREKIEAIREKLKVLRQLFGANPLGMAKAMAQIFKEMKSAVQDYRQASKQSMEASGEGVRAALANDEAEAARAESEADSPRPGPDTASSDARAITPNGLYEETVRATKALIGQEGLEFIDEVKSVLKKATDMLEAARIQSKGRKKDEATDKAFEEADTALKDLNEQMDAMAEDIRRAAPTAGMRLSVAA